MLIVEKKTPKTSAVDEVRRLWQKERDLDGEMLELAKNRRWNWPHGKQ